MMASWFPFLTTSLAMHHIPYAHANCLSGLFLSQTSHMKWTIGSADPLKAVVNVTLVNYVKQDIYGFIFLELLPTRPISLRE